MTPIAYSRMIATVRVEFDDGMVLWCPLDSVQYRAEWAISQGSHSYQHVTEAHFRAAMAIARSVPPPAYWSTTYLPVKPPTFVDALQEVLG
jgi:hypothetical protein